jgi:hypothetical protein
MTTPVPSAAARSPRSPFVPALLTAFLASSAAAMVEAGQNPPGAPGGRDKPVTTAGCLATEADFVRANGMRPTVPGVDLSSQVVIIDASGAVYSVNGTRERDLLTQVGSRVEVSGTLESWSSDVSLERLPEDVPLGAPAHELSDAATARVEGPVLTPPSLPRINVRSFHAMDGECAPLFRNAPARNAAAESETPVRRLASSGAPVADRVRIQGCVLRDPSGSDRLVLGQAVVRRPDVAAAGAVPGSTPSGTGSGTTPAPRTVSAIGAMQSFYLIGQDKLTAALLGSRAEILGTLAAAETAPPARGTAHPSAPVRELTVETVRSIGGACAP